MTKWQLRSPGDLRIVLGEVSSTDVNVAVTAAVKAYPAWSMASMDKRIRCLMAVKEDLQAHSDELARMIALEVGKPITEARGEVAAVIGKFDLTVADVERFHAPEPIQGGPFEAEVRHISRGPASVIGPFNFPLHLANGAICPHLIVGNTIVFKPSPIGALVGAKYAEIFQKHLPAGVFNLVQGGAEEGQAMCTDPRIRAISFTGSVGAGQAIAKSVAGDFSKNVALELGGKNAVLVLDDADVKAAAAAVAAGMCATAGQRCNDTSRAIVHRSVADAFCDALLEELKAFQPGNPTHDDTKLGVLVNEASHKRFAEAIQTQADECLLAGEALTAWEGAPGYYVKPCVFRWNSAKAGLKSPLIAKEVFAPLLEVFVADTDAEMIALHDAAPFGLSASIFTGSRERFEALGKFLKVGNLYANIPTTFSPSTLPFGGCKNSGNGKPGGRGFIRFVADEQAVQFGEGLSR